MMIDGNTYLLLDLHDSTETRLGLPSLTAKIPFFILARMAIQEAIPNLDFGGGEAGGSYPRLFRPVLSIRCRFPIFLTMTMRTQKYYHRQIYPSAATATKPLPPHVQSQSLLYFGPVELLERLGASSKMFET